MSSFRTVTRRVALAALALPLLSGAVSAQASLPSQITIMVPYPAGGPSDAIARILAPVIAKNLGGKTVIVENLGGGGGAVAASKTLNSRSDGAILYQGSPNELILAPLVNEEIKYKPEQLRLLTRITQNPLMLLVKNALPVKTFDELVALAKTEAAKGNPLTYGSVGIGSMYHIVTEDISSRLGTKVTHVPYKGGAPLIQDMMGGNVDFTILPYQTSYKGMQDQNKLRMLSWLNKEPVAFQPGVEAVGQSKALPGYDRDIWAGMFVKADTPEAIAQELHKAISAALADAEVGRRLAEIGSIVPPAQPMAEASKFYAEETKQLLGYASKIDLKASK